MGACTDCGAKAKYALTLCDGCWERIERGALEADADSRLRACTRCGHIGLPTLGTDYNGELGCALLIFFVIPGIIYFFMHHGHEYPVCAKCRARDGLVTLTTPKGREVLEATRASRLPTPLRRERACPFCAEQILAEAVICKHCRSAIPPEAAVD